MRLVCTGDLHLGVELRGRFDPITGLSSRLVDFLKAFDSVIDYAITNKVDLVVFAGDAYKTREPSPTHQREFAKRLQRLCVANIPSFLLVGNHDLPGTRSRAHSMEIFDILQLPLVTVASQIDTVVIDTASGPIQVISLPWVTRESLLSKEARGGKNLRELETAVLGTVTCLVEDQFERLDRDIPAILVGHCTVGGSVYSSERAVSLGQDIVFPLSLIAAPRLDYVALGHIHKHQILSKNPPVVYSGSIERIDFGEEKETKGFMDVTLGEEPIFVPLETRRFLTLDMEVSETDPTKQVLREVAKYDLQEAIVRVQIQNYAAIKVDEAQVRQALKKAYWIASISQTMPLVAPRRRSSEKVAGHSIQETMALYWKSKSVSQERQTLLMEKVEQMLGEMNGSKSESDRGIPSDTSLESSSVVYGMDSREGTSSQANEVASDHLS